jgi:hypothetical protein
MPWPRRRRRWLAGSDVEPPEPRRSEPENLGLGLGGADAGEKKLPWGGLEGRSGRRWLALPSRGADMECGGRRHPHLIFFPLSSDSVARSDRQGATGRIFNRGHG